MLSFNIPEITTFKMTEDHKQLLIRICPGLCGLVGKTEISELQETCVFICAGSSPITFT